MKICTSYTIRSEAQSATPRVEATMSTFPPSALVAASIAVFLFLYFHKQRRYKLPPGPPRLPFVGNLLNAPRSFEWLTYQAWSRQYSAYFAMRHSTIALIDPPPQTQMSCITRFWERISSSSTRLKQLMSFSTAGPTPFLTGDYSACPRYMRPDLLARRPDFLMVKL